MRGLHKSKRVSWASDLDLCQIRLFLSEESPSQVGLNSQDHLQAKTSLLLHPSGASSDDILPPGFEGNHAPAQFEIRLSEIPVIRWSNPPKLMLDLTWQVAAGEQSIEAEDQHQREMRVLEAIYPRPSSIPPNPTVSMDVEASHCIDDQIALIPITPIEDEELATDASSDSMAPSNSFELSHGIGNAPNSHASVQLSHGALSAASIALNNMFNSNDHGNLIDHELLNNILKNPEVMEKLVREYGASTNLQSVNNAGTYSVAYPHPPLPVNKGETSMPSSVVFPATTPYQVGPVSTQWLPRPAVSQATAASPAEVSLQKDASYYKSLIQQHGEQKQETFPYSSSRQIRRPIMNHETSHNSRTREPRGKIMKPCIFFNSSKGCRNGANCAYQHDVTSQTRSDDVPRIQSSKRLKMDSEISS